MTVIDIRNVFSDRRIELFEVNSSFIYYAEEKTEGVQSELFLLEYNRQTRRERLITNYTLEDPTFIQHIFSFEKTILLVLENGTNSLWVIEIDKRSGLEQSRRKIICTGKYYDCKALDANNLVINTVADEESKEFFKKYKELTHCDKLSYIYDIEQNKKFFIKCPIISKVGCDNLVTLNNGENTKLVIMDPFGDEATKEHYYKEQRWISADIRDNIWICDLGQALSELKSGSEEITVKCLASADIRGMIRFVALDNSYLYFKATHFKSKIEKICAYNKESGELTTVAEMPACENDNESYFTEKRTGNTYKLVSDGEKISVQGLNSPVDTSYSKTLGDFVACVENRFIITKKFVEGEKESFNLYYIYDTKTDTSESYECHCDVYGGTLILY